MERVFEKDHKMGCIYVFMFVNWPSTFGKERTNIETELLFTEIQWGKCKKDLVPADPDPILENKGRVRLIEKCTIF